MRRVLIDHARRRLADKRWGGQVRVTLTEAVARHHTYRSVTRFSEDQGDERRLVMNRRLIATVVPVFALGVLAGTALPGLGNSAGPKVTNLLTTSLSAEFTPEREILVDIVEIPPNHKLDWHWHPGEEFHYYLEGDPVIERADAPPIIGEPGTVGHIAFRQRHQATAGDQGAKIIVFRVHTKGAPWRYLDEAGDHRSEGEGN